MFTTKATKITKEVWKGEEKILTADGADDADFFVFFEFIVVENSERVNHGEAETRRKRGWEILSDDGADTY